MTRSARATRAPRVGLPLAAVALGLVLPLLPLVAAPAAAQDSYLLLIIGLEGDQEHGDRFFEWATTLVGTARTGFVIPDERIVVLADKPDRDPALVTARSTREAIEQQLAALAGRVAPDDVLFIVLFGHGTSSGGEARFNLPGRDLTAGDFDVMLDRFDRQQVVFVNTTASSGEFVEALSGPGRTVLTATRNATERFDTRFGGFFVEAFGDDEADSNKDRRVSVLEAFTYAQAQVERSFEQDGFLQTEHALLDDDGDGEGSQEPGGDRGDGRLAATQYLGLEPARTASGALITDPAVKQLYQERVDLERRLEELRAVKETMTPESYAAEFERLATELALKNREIRQREGQE